MAGYDPKRVTRSQTIKREEKKETAPATFTTGPLYTDYQVVEYAPEKLMLPNAFIAAQQVLYQETMLNDCLTFAVNQLLRHRFFVEREQVQRLWKESEHYGPTTVDARKINRGVSIAAFKDFFVKDNNVFSIKEVCQFKGIESFTYLKRFVDDHLIANNTFGEILILCSCFLNFEVVSHAGTFLRQVDAKGQVSVKYYDPNENHFFEKGDHRLDYKDQFSRFELITIYALDGRPVAD